MRPNQRRAAAHFSKRLPALILLWEWSKIWWLSISHGQSFKHASYAQAFSSSTWWIKRCAAPLRGCWVKGHVLILRKLLGLVTGMKDFQCLSWRECMRKKLRPAPAGRGQVKPSQSLNKTFFQMISMSMQSKVWIKTEQQRDRGCEGTDTKSCLPLQSSLREVYVPKQSQGI